MAVDPTGSAAGIASARTTRPAGGAPAHAIETGPGSFHAAVEGQSGKAAPLAPANHEGPGTPALPSAGAQADATASSASTPGTPSAQQANPKASEPGEVAAPSAHDRQKSAPAQAQRTNASQIGSAARTPLPLTDRQHANASLVVAGVAEDDPSASAETEHTAGEHEGAKPSTQAAPLPAANAAVIAPLSAAPATAVIDNAATPGASPEQKDTPTIGKTLTDQPIADTPDKRSTTILRMAAPHFAQALDPVTSGQAAQVQPGAFAPQVAPHSPGNPSAQAPAPTASVTLREGRFGTDVGIAIARTLDKGPHGSRDALLIRLEPRDMGRIDVRMTFEDDGTLRAVLSTDHSSALELLRREGVQLDRALLDAGVRTDGQSLRFDGGGIGGSPGQQHHAARQRFPDLPDFADAAEDLHDIPQAALRGSGQIDLIA